MTLNYNFSYLNCQKCEQKTHCNQCAEEIREVLLGTEGVLSAEVAIPPYVMTVAVNGADPDDIEELLEDHGVFV